MASLFDRFRRRRAAGTGSAVDVDGKPAPDGDSAPGTEDGPTSNDAVPAPAPPVRRRRPLPPSGLLRRERRELIALHEQRIRDLGGLILEMYRQDRFRQDLVYEQAAELVAIEDRLLQVDELLAAGTRSRRRALQHCASCGSPLVPRGRFCPSCGSAVAGAAT